MNTLFPRMHVSLYVSNINRSIEFYTRFFSLQPEKVKPGYAKYILEKPSLIISFVENKNKVQSNFGHLGFQVETLAELNQKLAEARSNDLETQKETGTNCCYANQDKFWVHDPDGVEWEVYYFRHDTEFNDLRKEDKSATVCCTVSDEKIKKDCGCLADVTSPADEHVACC